MTEPAPKWDAKTIAPNDFSPYQNESDCVSIGGLTFENKLDRVIVYGSLDITRDKKGLTQAEAIRELICSVVNGLNSAALVGNLPDGVDTNEPTVPVDNPFTFPAIKLNG